MTEVTQDNRGPRRLRELLAGPEPVVAPGAYDALSARLVAQAGFEAVYMTGPAGNSVSGEDSGGDSLRSAACQRASSSRPIARTGTAGLPA